MQKNGYSVFDLLAIGTMLVCGKFATLIDNHTFWGNIVLFFMGCSMPYVITKLFTAFSWSRNWLPVCQHGKCHAKHYFSEKSSEDGIYYRCRCGDLYLLKFSSRMEFRLVNEDGSTSTYYSRVDGDPRCRWVKQQE